MSVHFKPPSSAAPVADYREFFKWQETNRYKELVSQQDKVVGATPSKVPGK